jgi:hypothetical protein
VALTRIRIARCSDRQMIRSLGWPSAECFFFN